MAEVLFADNLRFVRVRDRDEGSPYLLPEPEVTPVGDPVPVKVYGEPVADGHGGLTMTLRYDRDIDIDIYKVTGPAEIHGWGLYRGNDLMFLDRWTQVPDTRSQLTIRSSSGE